MMNIDESKLRGEDGEIYVFQWLSVVEKELHNATLESMKSYQAEMEKTLVKIIQSPEPYPAPGRPLRNLVARCLVTLYTRGETRTLFDTMQTFLKVVGDTKSYDKDTSKIASFYCLGELMSSFGTQYMSFMNEIATSAIKTLRMSSAGTLLRFHALIALKKALSTAGRATTDSITKDILKFSRNSLGDKSLAVQRAAAEVLVVMYPANDPHRSVADIEIIINLCVKNLDSADRDTTRAFAHLVGHLLASTQTPKAPPPVDTSKKNKKDQNNNEEETPSTIAPATDNMKTILTPQEMLTHLSTHFNKQGVSRKMKVGIIEFYASLFHTLGSSFVETNYAIVVRHLFLDIVAALRPYNNSFPTRYETLLHRKLVGILLRDLIGVSLLSEQGQIGAIRELSSSYLKKWPALLPGQAAPDPAILVLALKEVGGLLQQLGNAPPPVQEALSDPLVTLLAHPNHSTRITAAWALRTFCYSTPLRLPKIILNVIELFQRDIASLNTPAAPSDINLRAVGHAYGLGGLFAVIPDRPLYISHDISAKVLDIAIQLLKRAGEHDIHVAGVEVEVAWTSISSLMALGPNFARVHLPQLLVLWRNALPKPTSKDLSGNSGRSEAEWRFLLHVRECALGAILCFLRHNSPTLVTLDVARRIASLLSNALSFVNSYASQRIEESAGVRGNVSISSLEFLLRRRIYQCFSTLGFSSLTEVVQTSLLQSAVSIFASPDAYTGSAVHAAIATSTGSSGSLWQTADGYAYGATSEQLASAEGPGSDDSGRRKRDRLNRDALDASIEDVIVQPIIGSCEHDPLLLCQSSQSSTTTYPEPPPPATSVVDSAIELFSILLLTQDSSSCTKIISELVDLVHSPKLEKNTGRRAAIYYNATVALAKAFRYAMASNVRQAKVALGNSQTAALLASFLKEAITDSDPILRHAASEALGRLASLSSTHFLTGQVKSLVDQVVNDRDPHSRAGNALAFGAIYTHVGGLAAGPLLKTTVNVLMSLTNDPHPIVHYWAMSALAQVIDAASLSYAPFVSSTLGMLYKVYSLESHEPEGGTLHNSNIKGDLPVYQVACRLIDAVITVLGPDIQESTRTRTLILDMIHEFSLEDNEGIRVEATKCIQHFLIFGPEYIQMADLILQLRGYLGSSRRPLKLAAIDALYQLVKRDVLSVSKLGGDKLVEELFGMLDGDPSIDGVRDVILSWLQQTAILNPSAWIDLCQRIMSRTTASARASAVGAGAGGGVDDEGASLSVGLGQENDTSSRAGLTSRWRTQLFALQCLHEICVLAASSGRREHLDIPFARSQGLVESTLLVSRMPDIIKMAFTASAAYVTEIRLAGLVVLRDVIEIFAKAPDPDYPESLLLEQHQAPVTAALTPAFSADSTPEILASSVQVCAAFVGCGVVTDTTRMGRILKLLTSALEQLKESETLTLGDVGQLSPNASVMLRISTLSAWAELQVASIQQAYLTKVVQPYKTTLSSLWVVSLRDYAGIRADSEVLQESGSSAPDSPFAGLGREVLLPYYTKSWPVMLQALATIMKTGDPMALAAMDGIESSGFDSLITNQPTREEPTAMFFPIFGLAYEALAASSADATSSPVLRQNAVIALEAMKCLVRPEYSGKALLEPLIFQEFRDLCYRMALTESAAVSKHLVEMVASFATSQGDRLSDASAINANFKSTLPADSPLTHCLQICACVLRRAILTQDGSRAYAEDTPAERIQLVTSAFGAFSEIGNVLGPGFKEEIRTVSVTLYAEMLKNEKLDIDLAGPTLQTLKGLLDNSPRADRQAAVNQYTELIHGSLSACLLNIDEMRGRQGIISTMKVKNNLLASVLILTSVPPSISQIEAVVEHSCFLITQKLLEGPEISLTAAHCAKTLIMASTTGNPLLQYCTKHLIPGIIDYLATVAALADDPNAQDAHTNATEELLKAFDTFFSTTKEEFRPRLLGILLPTMSILLNPQRSPPSLIHSVAIRHTLSFAAVSPAAFKEATLKMDGNTRDKLEASIRQAVGDKASQSSQAKPQISLRKF